MDLLDFYAAAALTGILASEGNATQLSSLEAASAAYDAAHAMLRLRDAAFTARYLKKAGTDE